MLATLLALVAAQALPDGPPPSPPEPPRAGLEQIFIAPSGEAFRAPREAAYPVAAWFAGADTDHDGKLTDGEFLADFLRYFAALDLNHDGTVDGVEVQAYETAMASELHTGTFSGDGITSTSSDDDSATVGESNIRQTRRKWNERPQGAGRFDLLRIPEPVSSMDTGLNGRISRQEAEDAAGVRFSVLDQKLRGYLVLAELPETFAQGHRVNDARRGKRSP